jgi:hypothetical protein
MKKHFTTPAIMILLSHHKKGGMKKPKNISMSKPVFDEN